MRRIILGWIVLLSGVAFATASPVSAAANPSSITISYSQQQYQVSDTVVRAQVGDTFQIVSALQMTNLLVYNETADVQDTSPAPPLSCAGASPCALPAGGTLTLLVVSHGTISVRDSGGQTTIATIELVAGTSLRPRTRAVIFDPMGGSCSIGDEVFAERWTLRTFRSWVRMPVPGVCSRDGFELAGWQSDSDELVEAGEQGSSSSDYTARWVEAVPPSAPASASILANFNCDSCRQVSVWWSSSPTDGSTYEVVVSRRLIGATEAFSVLRRIEATSVSTVDEPTVLSSLEDDYVYRIEVFAVKNGMRSVIGALFPPPAASGSGGSDEGGSVVTQVATPFAEFTMRSAAKSIAIMGERSTVAGKPGIVVTGCTTGFAAGDTVTPLFRFPGQISYSEAASRPAIGTDGCFSWQRKTGKKIYVFVQASTPGVISNRIIIAAN